MYRVYLSVANTLQLEIWSGFNYFLRWNRNSWLLLISHIWPDSDKFDWRIIIWYFNFYFISIDHPAPALFLISVVFYLYFSIDSSI